MNVVRRYRWATLVAANVLGWCVLSLYQAATAQTGKPSALPFANSVQQRFELIDEIRRTNEVLSEQNALLRSGKLRVIVEPAEQKRR